MRDAPDEDDDSDYSGFDTSAEDEDDVAPCPHCGAPIYEGAGRCPQCGEHISRADWTAPHRPAWVLAGVVVCFLIVAMWILLGL